ncbi:MAG: hypothetical protein IKW26_05255, partial [Treponema sp.]|nr:hypothetical protein [Treponema sp.]
MIEDFVYYKTLFLSFCFLFSLSFSLFSQPQLTEQEPSLAGEAAFWAGVEAFRSEDYTDAALSLQQVIASWSASSQQHSFLPTAT